MIVTANQYQLLLHEQLRATAPNLWTLLNAPPLSLLGGRVERLQARARQELRRITRFEVPARGFLEDDP